jgi:hypothetical protein
VSPVALSQSCYGRSGIINSSKPDSLQLHELQPPELLVQTSVRGSGKTCCDADSNSQHKSRPYKFSLPAKRLSKAATPVRLHLTQHKITKAAAQLRPNKPAAAIALQQHSAAQLRANRCQPTTTNTATAQPYLSAKHSSQQQLLLHAATATPAQHLQLWHIQPCALDTLLQAAPLHKQPQLAAAAAAGTSAAQPAVQRPTTPLLLAPLCCKHDRKQQPLYSCALRCSNLSLPGAGAAAL